jgi:hypothetical protein
VTDLPDPEANEADVLEQEAEVDPATTAPVDGLDDPLVEADEADLLEQSQSVPEDDADDVR